MTESALISTSPQMAATALVAARLAGIFLWTPVLGHHAVPLRFRLALCGVTAVAAAPLVTATSAIGDWSSASFLWRLASEMAFGAMVAVALQVVWSAFTAAGHLAAHLAGADDIDLVSNEPTGAAQWTTWTAIAVYVLADGPRQIIEQLLDSFHTIPPGQLLETTSLAPMVLSAGATLLQLTLAIAAPAVAALWIAGLVVGLVGRLIPQPGVVPLTAPIRSLVWCAGTSLVLIKLPAWVDSVLDASLVGY